MLYIKSKKKQLIEEKIKKELENEKYNWRTLEGIYGSLLKKIGPRCDYCNSHKVSKKKAECCTIKNITKREVEHIMCTLNENQKIISGRKKDGAKIYTTLKKYKKDNNLLIRIKDLANGGIVR